MVNLHNDTTVLLGAVLKYHGTAVHITAVTGRHCHAHGTMITPTRPPAGPELE